MKILSTMALFLSLLLWSNVAQALKCECKKANCEKMNDVRMARTRRVAGDRRVMLEDMSSGGEIDEVRQSS